MFEMFAPRTASLVCFRLVPSIKKSANALYPPHDQLPSPPITPTTEHTPFASFYSHSTADLDTLNQSFYSRLIHHPTHQVFLTSTLLNGVFCIRMAIGGTLTQESHVRKAFDDLCAIAQEILGEQKDKLTNG